MQNIAKKIISYLFILITIFTVGFFGLTNKALAESPDDRGDCKITTESASGNTPPRVETKENVTRGQCTALKTPTVSTVFTLKVVAEDIKGICTTNGIVTEDIKKHCEDGGGQWRLKGTDNNPDVAPSTNTGTKGAFETEVNKFSCGVGIGSDLFPACLIKFLYYVMYVFPSLLLAVVAYFFNVLISVTLGSTLLKSNFIPEAWGVVRDLSNIFFILILLYIAIKIILDIGGHEAKQMIAKVIIMALLINFSMFFTKVIIDTSNVLALIFYNKLSTGNKDPKTGEIVSAPYQDITGEKDISGGLVSAFNPTSALGPEFFTAAKKPIQLPGQPPDTNLEEKVPEGMLVGIIIITGAIFLVAIYALFISGLAFLGRLIELFILIIFSPFAFMSFVVPKLAHVEYLGWDDWLKRLISVSFMAPIFMFFLYFIFMLVKAKIYNDMLMKGDGIIITLLRMIIPALFVMILLLKATEYAKKGSGKFGEVAINGAKVLTGLAVDGVALGAAAAGRATVGATAKYVQNEGARKKDFKFTDLTTAARQGWYKPWKYPSIVGSAVTGTAKFIPAAVATGIHKVGIGKKLKEADENYGHKTHATHILDAKMQSEFGHEYGKDAKYKDLTEHHQKTVKDEVNKDEMAKFVYGKLFKDLEAPQAQIIQNGHNAGERAIADNHGKTVGIGTAPNNARDLNGALVTTGTQIKSDYLVDISKTSATLGEFSQALRKGSYDIRNLPDMSAKSKGFSKLGVAIIAGVASGVRLGFKKGGGVEYGTPQKDIFKDIGNTITEALKNVKINVGGGGGHGGGHDDGHTKEVKSVGH